MYVDTHDDGNDLTNYGCYTLLSTYFCSFPIVVVFLAVLSFVLLCCAQAKSGNVRIQCSMDQQT
jgi:hypothetical protein